MKSILKDIIDLWKHDRLCFWIMTAFAIVFFYSIGRYFNLSKSDAAAWVQAIGSIAAVIGSAWVAFEVAQSDARNQQRNVAAIIFEMMLSPIWHVAILQEALEKIERECPQSESDNIAIPHDRWVNIHSNVALTLSSFQEFRDKLRRVESCLHLLAPDGLKEFSFMEMKINYASQYLEIMAALQPVPLPAIVDKGIIGQLQQLRDVVTRLAKFAK